MLVQEKPQKERKKSTEASTNKNSSRGISVPSIDSVAKMKIFFHAAAAAAPWVLAATVTIPMPLASALVARPDAEANSAQGMRGMA